MTCHHAYIDRGNACVHCFESLRHSLTAMTAECDRLRSQLKLEQEAASRAEDDAKRLPDYFEAIKMPWHFAATFMAKFVDDEERPLGVPTHHARNLFHVAKALAWENSHLSDDREALLGALEKLREFKECMEAQRKSEPYPLHDDDEACSDGVCFKVGKLIDNVFAAAKRPR